MLIKDVCIFIYTNNQLDMKIMDFSVRIILNIKKLFKEHKNKFHIINLFRKNQIFFVPLQYNLNIKLFKFYKSCHIQSKYAPP